MRGGKGYALMVTLWALVLLSVVAMHFSFSSRLGSAATRNFKEDTIAYYAAVSAYEEALAYIATDPDPEVDFMDDEGVFRTDTERDSFKASSEGEQAGVKVTITDEDSRLNINTLSRPALIKLFEHAGAPEDALQTMADSLEDWKDADDLHRLNGAEDSYYAEFGYKAKDAKLDVPEELLLVKGFLPEYFYGTEDTMPLHSVITTWGEGVNVNTASSDVLDILGFSQLEINEIFRQRANMQPYVDAKAGGGKADSTSSSTLRVEVVARHADSPQAVKLTAVVSRSLSAEGGEPNIKTLFWKEEFESAGEDVEGSGS